MKLAIMTWYHYRNYGTVLQAVALTSVLRSLGHEPAMIRYKPCGYHRTLLDYSLPAFSKRILRRITNHGASAAGKHFCDSQKDWLFESFLDENITFTAPCQTKADLECLNDLYDAFICGSDQIWSPLNFDPKYYLDFVHESSKKIAYAPSFGVERIEDSYIQKEIASLLSTFGTLSVREAAGKTLIKQLSGRDSQLVLDPTLLLTAAQWEAQFGLNRKNDEEPYLLTYMLGNNPSHWEAITETAAHLGLRLRIIPVYENDLSRDGCIAESIGPLEFLKLIHEATYICTDSFHGMVFSLLFHRPYTAFARFQKHDAQNQNSRVFHMLNAVGMHSRLMRRGNWKAIANSKPDFARADRVINEMRVKSISYITAALGKKVQTERNDYSVMRCNSLCCGCGACQNICPVSAIDIKLNTKGFWEASIDDKKCIRCGKCKTVCVFCTPTRCVPATQASLSSFKSNSSDVLLHSSSGGAAFSIAKMLLRQGFCVVGCQYNIENQQAEHIIVHDEDQLSALQGSKYIQSNFSAALTALKHSAKPAVVFGTPCQIAATRRLLAERTNIIYVDLVCHGVPSYHLFRKYQEHIQAVSSINPSQMSMSFRYKPKGWADIHLYATDTEHEYCCAKTRDPFFRMFEIGACYNESCYECRWRVDSDADIRLADYWGGKFKTDQTGVSMFLCFTETGHRIMQQLRDENVGTFVEQPIDDYLTFQQSSNLPMPVFYDSLISEIKNERTKITDIVEKYAFPFENRKLSWREYLKYVFKMMTYRKP